MSNSQTGDVATVECVIELAAMIEAAEANLARTLTLLKETREWRDRRSSSTSRDAQIVSLPLPVMVLLAVVAFIAAFVFGSVTPS